MVVKISIGLLCYKTIFHNKIYYCSDVKDVQTYLHVFCKAGFSLKWLKLSLSIAVNISIAPTDLNSMSPVVSIEDGKTARVDILVEL